MTPDELTAIEQRTERVAGHSIQDRDVLALCREVRRLTAELDEQRQRLMMTQAMPQCSTCGYPMPGDECAACLNEMSERECVQLREEVRRLREGMSVARILTMNACLVSPRDTELREAVTRWRTAHWQPMLDRARALHEASEAELNAALGQEQPHD